MTLKLSIRYSAPDEEFVAYKWPMQQHLSWEPRYNVSCSSHTSIKINRLRPHYISTTISSTRKLCLYVSSIKPTRSSSLIWAVYTKYRAFESPFLERNKYLLWTDIKCLKRNAFLPVFMEVFVTFLVYNISIFFFWLYLCIIILNYNQIHCLLFF